VKKGYLLSLALLVSISGCGKSKKKNGRKLGDTEVLSEVNIPTADDGISSFFDQDVGAFVLNDDQDATDAAKNAPGYDLDAEGASQYAWLEQSGEFKDIYFDFDGYNVREDQEAALAYDIDRIKEKFVPGQEENWPTINVYGNACDSAGSMAYNMGIGEKRGLEVAKLMIQAGIPKANIKVVSRGSEVPARDKNGNPIKGDRAQQWPNRRDEIRIS
jgi:outer membrane protein OmpA-like peptidoglycan-associated protein